MTTSADFSFARFQPDDLPELIELHHELAPSREWWSAATAREQFTDAGRSGGQNTLIARRDGRIVAAAGWVELGAGDGEFYIAPFLVQDQDIAAAMVERITARAREIGADWVRARVWSRGDDVKEEVLRAAGFTHVFDFVQLSRPLTRSPVPSPVPPELDGLHGLHMVTADQVDPERFATLYNTAFAGVSNVPAVAPEVAIEPWRGSDPWPEASCVLADRDGVYQAYILVFASGYIDGVAVAPAMRRRGLARALMERVLSLAMAQGRLFVTSTCASDNPPSLALHRALGFVEVVRHYSWQLDL
jgi:GNAT superfamily N-acetyltransferase